MMRAEIQNLAALVKTTNQGVTVNKDSHTEQTYPNKRRRFEPGQVLSGQVLSGQVRSSPMRTESLNDLHNYVPSPQLNGLKAMEMAQPSISTSMPMKTMERNLSEGSDNTLDFVDELLLSPLGIEGEAALLREIEGVDEGTDMEPFPVVGNCIDVDPQLFGKLRSALSALPIQMQALYVERLIALFSNPAVVNQQVEAVTALALANAEVTQSNITQNKTDTGPQVVMEDDDVVPTTPEIPLKIAVATLGAFLQQYAEARSS